MGDTVLTNGRTQAVVGPTGNRASTRSTRKKKTQILTPKRLVEMLSQKSNKGFEAGVAEYYRECYLESPTFVNYFKEANSTKNFSKNVWLYDATRVLVPEVDYYHASWVDGLRPAQYILAQAPTNPDAGRDFLKLLVHVKAEGLIIADGADEYSNQICTKFDAGPKSLEKANEDIVTAVLNENGLRGLKTVRYIRWTDSINAVELMDMVEKGRKFLGCPLKTGPLVIVCKDGAGKSGLVAFLDTESDRLAKTGKVKTTESVKLIRTMRANTFDTFEVYDLGVNGIIELCNRAKKK